MTRRWITIAILMAVAMGAAPGKPGRIDPPPPWTMDPAEMKVPARKAYGRIHGKSFVMDRAVLENGVLTLRQGGDHFPDLAVDVMLWIKEGEDPQGKRLRIAPGDAGARPLIRLQWREKKGKGLPENEHAQGDYALVLEMGQKDANGRLPGKIYLCTPDAHKSVVAGTFAVGGAEGK